MSELLEVRVPDIGDFSDVPVVEVLVKPGDSVAADDPLLVLESDKASMEIPAPQAGTIAELRIAVGETVSEGSVVAVIQVEGAAPAPSGNGGGSPEAASDAARAERARSREPGALQRRAARAGIGAAVEGDRAG